MIEKIVCALRIYFPLVETNLGKNIYKGIFVVRLIIDLIYVDIKKQIWVNVLFISID